MFRVKLQGDPKVLDQYHKLVKTGIRGLAFVRTDPKIGWPKELEVELPQCRIPLSPRSSTSRTATARRSR